MADVVVKQCDRCKLTEPQVTVQRVAISLPPIASPSRRKTTKKQDLCKDCEKTIEKAQRAIERDMRRAALKAAEPILSLPEFAAAFADTDPVP